MERSFKANQVITSTPGALVLARNREQSLLDVSQSVTLSELAMICQGEYVFQLR